MEFRKPNDLKSYALNIEVYGDQPDDVFVESIKKFGIRSPITITSENRIISGHRRNQAAKILGLEKVPVEVIELTDELAIKEQWLLSNEYREKTNEQRAREFGIYRDIERERAAARQEATRFGGDSTAVMNSSPPNEDGKSREKAAAKVGLSHQTAERALQVTAAIDRAKEAGDTQQADELANALNKSVNSAYKKLKGQSRSAEHSLEASIRSVRKCIAKALKALPEGGQLDSKDQDHLQRVVLPLKAADDAAWRWKSNVSLRELGL